jgi:hypothetical protein
MNKAIYTLRVYLEKGYDGDQRQGTTAFRFSYFDYRGKMKFITFWLWHYGERKALSTQEVFHKMARTERTIAFDQEIDSFEDY